MYQVSWFSMQKIKSKKTIKQLILITIPLCKSLKKKKQNKTKKDKTKLKTTGEGEGGTLMFS